MVARVMSYQAIAMKIIGHKPKISAKFGGETRTRGRVLEFANDGLNYVTKNSDSGRTTTAAPHPG